MVELLIRPTLHRFETCLDFVKEFHPGERDLVLTNKYIYEPYLGQMGLPVHTIYQEEYGAGEPTDVMVDAILADAAKYDAACTSSGLVSLPSAAAQCSTSPRSWQSPAARG